MNSRLGYEMKGLARKTGGSYRTVDARIGIVLRFSDHLRDNNVQIQQVAQIKVRHIEQYIEARLAQGIGKRTLQNEMAALRNVLQQAGRTQVAEHPRLSNAALGLSGAPRYGTKQAVSPVLYRQVLARAQEKDAGMASVIELARVMGLRSQEAVQSVQSLKTWQRELEDNKQQLRVIYGTKGGRPRDTRVLDIEAVRQAVENALVVAEERGGRLIDKPDLKAAMEYWHNHADTVGLSGQYSPHSLRYAWAQDALAYYLSQGYSRQEALAQTAMDLGHGDGRGRYVAQVYGRKEQTDL